LFRFLSRAVYVPRDRHGRILRRRSEVISRLPVEIHYAQHGAWLAGCGILEWPRAAQAAGASGTDSIAIEFLAAKSTAAAKDLFFFVTACSRKAAGRGSLRAGQDAHGPQPQTENRRGGTLLRMAAATTGKIFPGGFPRRWSKSEACCMSLAGKHVMTVIWPAQQRTNANTAQPTTAGRHFFCWAAIEIFWGA